MKRFIPLFMSFILLSALCGVSSAEDDTGVQEAASRPGPGKAPPKPLTAAEVVERMKKELDLSGAQVEQVTAVIEKEMTQMRAVMEQEKSSGPGERSASGREKMKVLHENTEKELAQYLTAEQLEKWKHARPGPPPGKQDIAQGNTERRSGNE